MPDSTMVPTQLYFTIRNSDFNNVSDSHLWVIEVSNKKFIMHYGGLVRTDNSEMVILRGAVSRGFLDHEM